ncbi:hypothetical protein CLV72_10541 [Allonocardiopsis opalescens]|uniref:Nudix hydrolase domain-containing protein n=2 Tax=Allonocardiopsis opalescens TaxID=1144618 RepID=A0A2T0Q1P4_9ACTN|nr:hypothetical protein CLV72_10541 [Allonocardiopsis opalescens]
MPGRPTQAPSTDGFIPPDSIRDFRIGPLQVPCQIVEGDGERAIEEENVRVMVDPVEVELPLALARDREKIAAEQERLRATGRDHAWIGLRYAVDDLVISRIGPQEHPTVTLRLKYSDYYTFLATQKPGYRRLYVDGRDPRNVPNFMRSSFGLNVAIVTADGWLVVSRRSDRLGVGKGVWNSSANEGLHREKDSVDGAAPNLFRAAERGVREELGLDPHQYRLRLLAFAAVTSLSQWCALFIGRLYHLTRDEFIAQASRSIADRWEHVAFDYVSFEPEAVLHYLLRADRRDAWAPAAPVLFYLSLTYAYGAGQVGAAVTRVLSWSE